MENRHTCYFTHAPERIRPWIERAWTGTPEDVFPRDVLRTWRKNPEGVDPMAFVPGTTWIGHGPFRFRAERWDGSAWRVRVEAPGVQGWHGFDLSPAPGGARLTHTLQAELGGLMRLEWPLFIAPLHDWVVEALFDRLEAALATGAVPEKTQRPMPFGVRVRFAAMRRLARNRVTARRRAEHEDTPASGGAKLEDLTDDLVRVSDETCSAPE
jgi:hypothetical protein